MNNKTKKPVSGPEKQPLSPLTYAWISLVAFGICIGLLLLFIFKAEDLIAYAISEKVFYVLLIILGLSAAAFLFGVMRCYATYKGKVLNGALELGGPVVLAILVVVGGFKLVPDVPDTSTFPLTVYVHGSRGKQDIVLKNEGEVMIDLGNERLSKKIGEYGDAYFPAIPGRFRTKFRKQCVPITVAAKGFELANPGTQPVLTDQCVYVEVKRDGRLAKVLGTARDAENNFLKDVHVYIQIGSMEATTDKNGKFTIEIPPETQKERQTLTACKDGYQTWEEFVYPGTWQEVKIILTKK